jgi:hypothetical protein
MKWTYSIKEKLKAAFLLACVLVVVFGASLMYKNSVSELGDSFSSVYEDRLVVESYIYKFSDYLYQKKIVLDDCHSVEQISQFRDQIAMHNKAIEQMIHEYEKTKLTDAEKQHFETFKTNMSAIMSLEASMMSHSKSTSEIARMEEHVDHALGDLKELSGIQLSEAKILNDNTKKIVAGSTLLSQFELVILIVIGLMIQALVFASNTLKSKFPGNPGLN